MARITIQEIHDLIVRLLDEQAKTTKKEEARLAEERGKIALLQKEILLSERRTAVAQSILMETGELIPEIRAMTDLMRSILNRSPLTEEIRELSEGIAYRMDRIEIGLSIQQQLLGLALPHLIRLAVTDTEEAKIKGAVALAEKIGDGTFAQEIESIQLQLSSWKANLLKLRERRALHGIDPPTDLSNEIEMVEREVEKLEFRLRQIRKI